MEANEPCLGRWVHDDASGLEGLVIEVKTGGWRVVLGVGGNSVNRRSGALEYAAGEPPAELVNLEDAAAAPPPPPAEPSPTPFSGHALLQGLMQG